MSPASDRRGFLRGLVSLPLVGGSVALIGSPVRAAVPASRAMLADYADWLGLERWRTLETLYGTEAAGLVYGSTSVYGEAYDWFRHDREGPAVRAPVLLSAAGMSLVRT